MKRPMTHPIERLCMCFCHCWVCRIELTSFNNTDVPKLFPTVPPKDNAPDDKSVELFEKFLKHVLGTFDLKDDLTVVISEDELVDIHKLKTCRRFTEFTTIQTVFQFAVVSTFAQISRPASNASSVS